MQPVSRASGWWYVAAIAPVVLGVLIVVAEVANMFVAFDHAPSVLLPGDTTVALAADHYMLFAETEAEAKDGVDVPACEVTEPANGTALAFSVPWGLGGRSDFLVEDFDAPRAGTYHVTCKSVADGTAAFARMHGESLMMMIIAGLVTLFLSLPCMIAGVIVVYRKRRRAAEAYLEVVK